MTEDYAERHNQFTGTIEKVTVELYWTFVSRRQFMAHHNRRSPNQ